MTHLKGKILVENFGEKWHHINSGENLSNFCSLHFLSNLNPIWEKRVCKFKFCSFYPDYLNQHCIWVSRVIHVGTFPIKLNQFEKIGAIGKTFISQVNLIIKFHFRNFKSITFFVTFASLLLDSGTCLPFKKENEVNLKRNQKSNREKSKLSVIIF